MDYQENGLAFNLSDEESASRLRLDDYIGNRSRKEFPIVTGLLDYFPLACAAVAHVSYVGNQQHSDDPNAPMQWDRNKSSNEADCFGRHYLDRGSRDVDNCRHLAKAAWRILADLQKEIEKGGSI
jgi:hypothetical protein